jgi:anti-sigma B factor antagonist
MKITSKIQQYSFVIELNGDLLGDQAGEVNQILEKALDEYPGTMLIDCRNLRYLSAAGINCFLFYQQAFRVRKIPFILCNLSPKCLQTIHLLKLENHFTFLNKPDQNCLPGNTFTPPPILAGQR